MMLHLLMEKGPWFRAKRFGYGAGLPFKWQGWVLLAAHMAIIVGIAAALAGQPVLMMALLILAAIAPFPLYRARTEGGWRWRIGGADEDQCNG
jgi:hypothetical protein